MNAELRNRFDRLLEQVLAELPEALQQRLEEVPVIADDRPPRELLRRFGARDPRNIRGLYTGIPLVRRSVMHSGTMPDRISIYREGIVAGAGGVRAGDAALKDQIRRTVLHEIGHHFGLGEGDLRGLGY